MKSSKKLFLTVISGILLNLNLNAADDIKTKIKEIGIFKPKSISINKVIDKGSIYHIGGDNIDQTGELRSFDAFVTKDLKYVILGQGFDAEKGSKLFVPKDMSDLAKEDALTIGTGKKEFYLFTDPECPYCVKLEKQFTNTLTKETLSKIRIHVFLYPLPFHKDAKNMSYYILSQNSNEKRYMAMKEVMAEGSKKFVDAKYSTKEIADYNKILEKHLKISRRLNVQGTPTLFNSKGKRINPAELLN